MSASWDWPGARWWKCDLHVHSPGSYDFPAGDSVQAADWLNAARNAGLDVVAVTDHNTGAFIDKARRELPHASPLHFFPGVELTVQHGIHLLVLFDPALNADAITAFLGACNIPSEQFGKKEALSSFSLPEAMYKAVESGALCIAAHADDCKGFLKEIQPSETLQRIVKSPHLHGVELNVGDRELAAWVDNSKPEYRREIGQLAVLTFSDAHALDQIGRRFTWIKMTRPDLNGLRLALQDGPLSVMPRASVSSDPNAHATHVLESIEIRDMKYIGQGKPLEVKLNPWLNAIIGGRGTGKSSILECVRIVFRREDEIPEKLKKELAKFKLVYRVRGDEGLLRDSTQLTAIYRKDGVRFRIRWDYKGTLDAIEEGGAGGGWVRAAGDVRSRFPVRIYSQKQIFEMAGDPGALLGIVDESPEVRRADWDQRWREEESRFLALRAKARELRAGLEEEGRIKGELDDVKRKLALFEQAGHADILREYQLRERQQRNARAWQEGFSGIGEDLRGVAEKVPSSVDLELFDSQTTLDSSVLDLARDTSGRLRGLREKILALATEADAILQTWSVGLSNSEWQASLRTAAIQYSDLAARGESQEGAGASVPALTD